MADVTENGAKKGFTGRRAGTHTGGRNG
jgi:hypothetical protein